MNRKKNRILLFIALFLYIPLGLLQVKINFTRTLEDLEGRMLLMPGQVAGSLVLGGFRGIAADLLWLQVEELWHSGQHYKMLPILDSVAWLQPQYITVWAIGGWHMSYNIFANIDGKASKLERELEEKIKDSPEQLQGILKQVSKVFEDINRLKEDLQGYYSNGMPEIKIPSLLAELDKYDAELEELHQNKDIQPIVEIVQTLATIPREQIFWYSKGIEFLRRGITYNRERYDIYFELGWTYYHKGMDYPNAARYLSQAVKFPHPDYVDNVLAHSYELNGEVDKALEQWEKQLDSSFKNIAERAIYSIKKEGAFNPKRRRIMGLED